MGKQESNLRWGSQSPLPYRLAIPQYERQGMSETYLSPKGVKSMRKQLKTRRALRSWTAVVRIMVSSAVERMARCPCSSAYTPIRRLHGKSKTEDRLQPKLSCVPVTDILYSSKMKMSMETPQIWRVLCFWQDEVVLCVQHRQNQNSNKIKGT